MSSLYRDVQKMTCPMLGLKPGPSNLKADVLPLSLPAHKFFMFFKIKNDGFVEVEI